MSRLSLPVNAFELRKSYAFRIVVSFACALLVNTLLLYLIYQLVTNSQAMLTDLEDVYVVDFIRVKPEPKPPKNKDRKEPIEKQDEPELLHVPLQIQLTEYDRPSPLKLVKPKLALDIPIDISGGPYIGDFKATATPTTLDAGEPRLQIPPVYPLRARRAGIEGSVTVEFTITADGAVRDAKIITADPPKIFNRAVLRALRHWKFHPRMVHGKAVERRAQKKILFNLDKR